MTALLCAVVAAQKSRRSLLGSLRILAVSPAIKVMAFEDCRGMFEQEEL